MLNSTNFQEFINSPTPVVVKFSVKKGCPYCEKYKPTFDLYAESHTAETYEKEDMKAESDEIMKKYTPQGFPTTVAFQNGKVINKIAGALTEEQLLNITKTLQNISPRELESYRSRTVIDMEKAKLEVLKFEGVLTDIYLEYERRQNEAGNQETTPTPIEDFPLPTNTATT